MNLAAQQAHVSSGSAMLLAAATAGSAIRLLYETSTTAVLVRLWRYVRTKARRQPPSGTDLGSAMTRRQSVVCHDGASPASDVQRRACMVAARGCHTASLP